MSFVSISGNGHIFPTLLPMLRLYSTGGGIDTTSFQSVGTIDAATEKLAFIGHVKWSDNPTAAKTVGASSKIHFRTGAATFADAGTNLRIGLQDVSTASGPPVQPDGTFDVYADVAGNSGLITSSDDSVLKSITLSTSGSKSVAQDQLIAIVFEMTARGGTDSLGLTNFYSIDRTNLPTSLVYIGSWAVVTINGSVPNVMLEAEDGTFGILRGAMYIAHGGQHSFASTSTPDEYALLFQVPYACKVDAVILATGNTSATADFSLVLYSTPTGTPTALATVSVLGEHLSNQSDDRYMIVPLGAEYGLQPNTDYAIAMQSTGAGNAILGYFDIGNAAHRTANGLGSCRQGTRTNATGAFSETTTRIPLIGVQISALDDGAGMGKASLNIGI